MANQNNSSDIQTPTERELAHATPMPTSSYLPREMQIERVGNLDSGVTIEWPKVRGGVCDFCGVIDSQQPSHYQYKLCGHYRGKQLACSYCPVSKDVDDVIHHSVLRVLSHPDRPNTLIVHCDAYDCLKKHEAKWKRSNS